MPCDGPRVPRAAAAAPAVAPQQAHSLHLGSPSSPCLVRQGLTGLAGGAPCLGHNGSKQYGRFLGQGARIGAR
jgi:hypothetical protein